MKSPKIPKVSWLSLALRLGLFTLILVLGTVTTLVLGEVESLARADLSQAPIRTMATAPEGQALYATLADAARLGIYRSEDYGRTWQLASPGPGVSLNTLIVHPVNEQVLYAGAAGGPVASTNNLWRSDDGGKSWRKFFLSLPGNVDGVIPAVTALAIDPTQPQALYVGTAGQGVYRFDVGYDGYGYELVGGVSLHEAQVAQLMVGPDNRVYALTVGGLFTSKGDEAWQKLDTLPDYPVSLAVAPTDPDTLYAGAASSGAYLSTDGGRTWTNIADGLGLIPGAALRVTALTVDEADSWHVAAATAYGIGKRLAGGGVYESKDGGRNWAKLGDVDDLVTELTFSNGEIQAATAHGLIRFGAPSNPASPPIPFGLDSLIQLSGRQIFVLTLTTGLAGLALVGHKRWG